jgi:hypothetical protein
MMIRRVTVVVAVLVLGAFPSLAQASPTDPLWVGGVYDAGDWDDAVLALAFADGIGARAGTGELCRPWIAGATIDAARPFPPISCAFSAFGGRAPPDA